jgi:hypothetical protein
MEEREVILTIISTVTWRAFLISYFGNAIVASGDFRWMPHIKEKNTFMQGGQNVAIKRNNEVRIVPLCNGCITLYYERGWLAVKK